jgi:hypothetical protein
MWKCEEKWKQIIRSCLDYFAVCAFWLFDHVQEGRFLIFLGAITKLRKQLLDSPYLSVCPSAWTSAVSAERIFMKFGIWLFFENLLWNFYFDYNLTNNSTLHEDQCTFMAISDSIFLGFRNVSGNNCRKN